jgi:hypothetical protein
MKPKIRSASITLSTFAAPAATASRATLEDPLTAYQGESNAAGRAPPRQIFPNDQIFRNQ